MQKIMKRTAVILMAFVMMLTMMPVLGSAGSQKAYATDTYHISSGGFTIDVYDDGGSGSVWIMGYTGSNTELVFPSTVSAGETDFNAWNENNQSMGNGAFSINSGAFKGNTSIKKIAVPDGYEGIDSGAFQGCTGLVEASIGAIDYGPWCGIGAGAFTGCTNLVTYNIDSTSLDKEYNNAATDERRQEVLDNIMKAGIGTDAAGNPIAGVTVYTQNGSTVWKAIEKLNETRPEGEKINLVPSNDPYGRNTISPATGGSGSGIGGSGSGMGEDGTAYGPGASESVVDKAITKYAKEKDPKGTSFGLLQARLKAAKKTSITLQWKSVKGAKKYIVYGNACGTKNKLKKMVKKTTKTKMTFKKVAGKKVKAGKPYKFVIVAIDKNGKVISTSKIVHAATKGGTKWVNAKSVTTKAKKNKVTLKKGKKFSLKAKTVAEKGKGKLINHRGISYETSNKKVATVNSKGVITAKGKGTCTIYAYAHNGVFKAIKVTVN